MKIPRSYVIKMTVPVIAIFSMFACTKDTDLLADYVIADAQNSQFYMGLVQDDVFFSSKGSSMILDVLANDGFADPDKVKIVEVTQPFNGSVVINEDKTLTYTPGGDPTSVPVNENNTEDEPIDSETTSQTESETPTAGQEKALETESQPEADPMPEPAPQPKPEPAPKPEPEPEPQLKPEPAPQPKPEPTPKPEPEPESEADQETDDNFGYKVEVSEDDGAVTEQEGTVTITTKKLDYGVLKAFPTAYGAGSNASGGRRGSVYHVTNLNNSGKGSFRDAVSQGNRTVVFDVSGTIKLTSNLSITADNLTIAGQTAPVGGISITGKHVFFNNNDNLIIRYLRFRPYWVHSKFGVEDGVNFTRVTNAIIDHCSVAFGVDEAISFVGSSNRTYASDNITMQRTLSAYSSKGTIAGYTNYTDVSPNGTPGGDFSFNQNMWVHISHRFPLVVTHDRADAINNVVHNWLYKLTPLNQSSNVKFNQINNYWQRGCLSNVIKNKQVNQMDYDKGIKQLVYNSGNIINGEFTNPNADNSILWNYWLRPTPSGEYMERVEPEYFTRTPFPQLGHQFAIKSAEETFVDVTSNVGANAVLDKNGNKVKSHDTLDNALIYDAKNNICFKYTYRDDRSKYQAHKDYHSRVSSTPINSHDEHFDSDRDGMPDAWELIQGFNPNKQDHNDDFDGNGYTNLEEYLNLVDF